VTGPRAARQDRGMAQRSESGLVTETRGHVRVLTLDRAERRNALSGALQADLVAELLDCAADGEVRAVVLTGNGPAFCAGFDLKEIRELDQRGEAFRPPMNRPGRNLFEVLTETYVPVIAALTGHAVAGGFELALACEDAERWGLVNRVVPAEEVLPEALALAERIAANAPLSVRRMKETALKGLELPLATALRLDVGPNPYLSEDRKEGIAARLEKRPPRWSGR
jgi:enoyl-CoA hydratase/carnithine racemase